MTPGPAPASSVTAARDALVGVYSPEDVLFVEGRGTVLVDEEGTECLDFTSGIGACALGHDAPVVREAVEVGLDAGLVHTSNLFRTEPAETLARILVDAAFDGEGGAFFCNSGAEANEAAFKFARRWARASGGEAKHEIVALRGSFHGRLFASLAATDRPEYRAPFEPLVPGIRFAGVEDEASVDAVVSGERTAAVIAEPVQGEGGIRPLSGGFLSFLRARCDAAGAALIFDEVQCGMGRTGELFAHRASGVEPDILTLAKPLAGGLPMGAAVAAPDVAAAVRPGDHATTFGGGPLVAGVAKAVVRRISDPGFLSAVREKGSRVRAALRRWEEERDAVRAVRGRGLMWGIEIDGDAREVVARAFDAGLLVLTAGAEVVRLLPPLTVGDDELDRGLEILEGVLP